MNAAGLLLLLIAHYFTGRGIIKLFNLHIKPIENFGLSLMVGVAFISVTPNLLQFLHIPIVKTNVIYGVVALACACSLPLLIKFKVPRIGKLTLPQLYEIPFFLVFLFIIVVSVWRCFYLPATARDMIAGPELIAEYAVREGTLLNSVFSVDLSTTNNHFKSSYITGLQIVYKLMVAPFGQLWLSVIVIGFLIFLYSILRSRLHPLLACFIFLLFLTIPDVYAYTYLILYDYSNMIFFFSGFYFLTAFLTEDKPKSYFLFSSFLFGLATFVRTDTAALIAMLYPMMWFQYYRKKAPVKDYVFSASLLAFPFIAYIICIHIFLPAFVPFKFDVSNEINPNLGDVSFLFQRLQDIFTLLIFSAHGLQVYGYFIHTFLFLLIADAVVFRKFSKQSSIILYGIVLVVVGLAILSYLLPLVDLRNTTKRGLFKAVILMVFYMANSNLLQRLSSFIYKMELPKDENKAATMINRNEGLKENSKEKVMVAAPNKQKKK